MPRRFSQRTPQEDYHRPKAIGHEEPKSAPSNIVKRPVKLPPMKRIKK